MCGIAGIVSKSEQIDIRNVVSKMSSTLAHRGPDGEGFLLSGGDDARPLAGSPSPKKDKPLPYLPEHHISGDNGPVRIALAHRRLSILDLSSAGHGPMCDGSSRLWLTYNGEIYNYKELRAELEAAGHTFVSGTDTEVVLYAYRQWGKDCVQRFNGMWAFSLLDLDRQVLFCSRDRLGVKPFYYAETPDFFAFASEQKAFIRSGLLSLHMDQRALHAYLVNAALERSPENFFGGVQELWPGHSLEYDLRRHTITVTCYFNLEKEVGHQNDQLSDNELVEKISALFEKAVSLRLRSDVEVGTCLSGGIDSSAIAATISSMLPHRLHCFTAAFTGRSFDEGPFARLLASRIGAVHHITEPSQEEFSRDLSDLVYSQDVPIWDTSTYAQHRVMGLAKENGIKVVLDGQGADELFTGYHHHYTAKWNNQLKNGRVSAVFKEMSAARRSIAFPAAFYMKERLKAAGYSAAATAGMYLESSFVKAYPGENPFRYKDDVNLQLVDDITRTRLKIFLKCEDRCGMWHSVESRTPFSDDIDLIRFMFSFDGNRKIRKGRLKYLLREAVRDKLPPEIYDRLDKKGFETPMRSWLQKLKPAMVEEVQAAGFSFIRPGSLSSKTQDAATEKLLFRLFILARWKKVFSG